MSTRVSPSTDAWLITDVYGYIRRASQAGRALLGLQPRQRKQNLLLLFPQHCKAIVFDIELALTGWPTGRTLSLPPCAARPLSIRYRVSRYTDDDGIELFWHLEAADSDVTPRCA